MRPFPTLTHFSQTLDLIAAKKRHHMRANNKMTLEPDEWRTNITIDSSTGQNKITQKHIDSHR
jgi:hypothetical protein